MEVMEKRLQAMKEKSLYSFVDYSPDMSWVEVECSREELENFAMKLQEVLNGDLDEATLDTKVLSTRQNCEVSFAMTLRDRVQLIKDRQR